MGELERKILDEKELCDEDEEISISFRIKEIDSFIIHDIKSLNKKGLSLIPCKYNNIKINEKQKSYEIVVNSAKKLYISKHLYNREIIISLIKNNQFTDFLIDSSPFLKGFLFIFKIIKNDN